MSFVLRRRWRARIDRAFCGARSQLLLLVAGTLGPLVLFAAYSLHHAIETDTAEAGARAAAAAGVIATRVEEQLAQMQVALGSMVASVGGDVTDVATNDARLALIHADQTETITTLSLVGQGGRILASSTLGLEQRRGINVLRYECIRNALARPLTGFSPPIRSGVTGAWAVIAFRSILDADGRILAVAAVNTRLELFVRLMNPAQLVPGSIVTITDSSGIVVARSVRHEDFVGRDISERVAEHAERFRNGPAVWHMLDGVERVGAMAETRRHGWKVVVGVPVAAVRAAAWGRHGRLLIAAALALIVGIAAAWSVSRRIATPLVALGHTVRRYTRGELSARADVRGVAEIARLARRFNHLVERRQRELAALDDSHARLAVAVQAARVGLWEWDLRTDRVQQSDEWRAQLGYGPDELPQTLATWQERLHPDDASRVLDAVGRYLLAPCEVLTLEYRLRSRDGSYRWFLCQARVYGDRGVRPRRLVGGHVDITAQKENAAALEERSRRLHALSRRMAAVEEAERRRVGRELHDQIGGSLSALKLLFDLLLRRLPPQARQVAAAEIDHVQSRLRDTVCDLRGVLVDLRPPTLEEFGLLSALREYGSRVSERTGLAVAVGGQEPHPRLEPATETACFRIAQEALSNAVKHARCSSVDLHLTADRDAATLTITDHGAGCDAGAITSGPGIRRMMGRAEAVGAGFELNTAPGAGVEIRVTLARKAVA